MVERKGCTLFEHTAFFFFLRSLPAQKRFFLQQICKNPGFALLSQWGYNSIGCYIFTFSDERRRGMHALQQEQKKRAARWAVVILWALAVTAFSLALGAKRIALCSYVSVNGDWQSYNVFRRMLAGQRPYADFANYIGMAPVYTNLPLLFWAGGSFADSLFITNFTANVLFSLAVFCIFYLATQKLLPSLAASALLSKVISTQIFRALLGESFGGWLTDTFTGLYTPSNSMRVARSWLPFLFALLLLALRFLLAKRAFRIQDIFLFPGRCAISGLILGLCISWSSDYGLACLAAASVIFLFLQFGCYCTGAKRFFVCLFAYAGAVAAGVLLSAVLMTGGAPEAWFASLSATGEYQYFYFNGTGSRPAVSYLFACGRFWLGAAFCIVFLAVCTIRLFQKKLSDTGLILYFVMASVLAGTVAYILAGSGYNAREPLEGYSLVLALALLVRGMYEIAAHKKASAEKAPESKSSFSPLERVLSGLFALAVAGSAALCCADAMRSARLPGTGDGVEIAALGGVFPYPQALQEADTLTGNDAVFSVYATGLEAVKGQFQPTGYDYIIHALGKEAQQQYLSIFTQGNYAWVQTPDLPVDDWVSLQNWYFYREVWRYYEKVQSTEYSWLWQRTGDHALNAQVTVAVAENGDGSVTLQCTGDDTGCYIADVRIEYTLSGGSTAAKLANLGRGSVYAATGSLYADDETYTGFCMPASGVQYVPVIMQNGSGSVRLSSLYEGGGSVTVSGAACEAALPRWNLHTADTAAGKTAQ
jgi:hypothetical protein